MNCTYPFWGSVSFDASGGFFVMSCVKSLTQNSTVFGKERSMETHRPRPRAFTVWAMMSAIAFSDSPPGWIDENEVDSVCSAAGAAAAGCFDASAPIPLIPMSSVNAQVAPLHKLRQPLERPLPSQSLASDKPLGRPLELSRVHLTATSKWSNPGMLSFERSYPSSMKRTSSP